VEPRALLRKRSFLIQTYERIRLVNKEGLPRAGAYDTLLPSKRQAAESEMDAAKILEILASIVTIAGLFLIVLQIRLDRKEASNSRHLDIVLSLSESFRSRWESGWRGSLGEIEKAQDNIPPKQREQLCNMLNWIDWCGRILKWIDRGSVGVLQASAEELLFQTVGPQFKQIIEQSASQSIMSEAKSSKHWVGVDTVREKLGNYGI
jgi:hypothetical protein